LYTGLNVRKQQVGKRMRTFVRMIDRLLNERGERGEQFRPRNQNPE
jgi:hypothetical protein